jgi:hypothetical protein
MCDGLNKPYMSITKTISVNSLVSTLNFIYISVSTLQLKVVTRVSSLDRFKVLGSQKCKTSFE